MLRPFWEKIFKYNWAFGLTLILLFGIPRFIIVLNANITGNYGSIALIFLLMWFSPLVFLTKSGRRYIGIKKPDRLDWLLYSFLAGVLVCSIIYIIAIILFDHSISNCYVYISRSYKVPMALTPPDRLTYFLIYSLTGITLSPIGEELFYRGLVHGSFAVRFGEKRASVADSLAFALTHLAHFGIVYNSGRWQLLIIPALLWVISMFIASRVFFLCKQKTGSILGAIISHAAFNVAMMYFIFYHIMK